MRNHLLIQKVDKCLGCKGVLYHKLCKTCPKILRYNYCSICRYEWQCISLTGHTLADGNKAVIPGISNSQQNWTPPPCFPSVPMPRSNRNHIEGIPEAHNVVLFQLQPSICSFIYPYSLKTQHQGTAHTYQVRKSRTKFSAFLSAFRLLAWRHCLTAR
jgi:hypothetical protein